MSYTFSYEYDVIDTTLIHLLYGPNLPEVQHVCHHQRDQLRLAPSSPIVECKIRSGPTRQFLTYLYRNKSLSRNVQTNFIDELTEVRRSCGLLVVRAARGCPDRLRPCESRLHAQEKIHRLGILGMPRLAFHELLDRLEVPFQGGIDQVPRFPRTHGRVRLVNRHDERANSKIHWTY